MIDRREMIQDAVETNFPHISDGKMTIDDFFEAVKITSKLSNITHQEIVTALSEHRRRRLQEAALLEIMEQIGQRLNPPPNSTDMAGDVIQRAAEQGDEQARRLLSSVSLEQFLADEEAWSRSGLKAKR